MKYIPKLGIPYMGSKRKLAKPLMDFMIKENPNAKYFYDVFWGGSAMSFEALQRREFKQVFYSEFSEQIVNLLIKIRDDGITEEFYEWVDILTDKGYKVYISSYESHLPCVLELKHRGTLSATANNSVTEKLFCNFEVAKERIEDTVAQKGLLDE